MDKKIQHLIFAIIAWVYIYHIPNVSAEIIDSKTILNSLLETGTLTAITPTAETITFTEGTGSETVTVIGTATAGTAGTAGTAITPTAETGSETVTLTEGTGSGTETSTEGTGSGTETSTAETEVRIDKENKDKKQQGTLRTHYLDLSFKHGGKSQSFAKGEQQRAISKLSSTGTGTIQIRWEIARPPFANKSDPVFSLIHQATKTVVGHQQQEFSSPILPSQQIGLYLLRVRVITSTTHKEQQQQSALIRYYITPAKQNTAIQLLTPTATAVMDTNTYFRWRTNSTINQTNIQIFATNSAQTTCNIALSQQPIVEIATKNSQQSLMTPIAAQQLQNGQPYCWRIQMYNKGNVVGFSKVRSFIWQKSSIDNAKENIAVINPKAVTTDSVKENITVTKPNVLATAQTQQSNNSIATLLFKHEQQIKGQVIAQVNNQQQRQQLINHPDVRLIEAIQLYAYPLELMLIQSRSNRSVSALMAELKQQLPHIQVQPNFIYQQNAGSVPQYSLAVMKVKQNNRQAGRGVRIGIIDTLIDTQHASLRSANIKQINLLSKPKNNGKVHGTAIASLIVGQSGMRGIAPAAKLISIAAFYAQPSAKTAGRSSSFLLAQAFDKAVLQNIKVLNLSFGSARKDPLLNRLVKGAKQKGIILVASVGNSAQAVYYPAALSAVIAVTATDANNKLYARANRGKQVELAAPGVGIMAARAHGKYTYISGTSFATAHITGMIAHLISQGKSSSRSNLHQAAKDLGAAGKDNRFGYGLLTL